MRNRELMRSSYIYIYIYAKYFYHAFMDKFVFIFPLTSSLSPFTKWVTNVGLHSTLYSIFSRYIGVCVFKAFFFFVSRIYKDGGLHCILVKCEHSLPCPLSVFSFSLIIIRLSPSLFAGSYIYTPPTIPCFKN